MQGQRGSILMAIVLPLALIGCSKEQTQPAPAPVAAMPGGPTGPPTGANDPPAINLTILHKAKTKHGEAHQLVGPGTTVVWEYDQSNYEVIFTGNSPCDNQSYPLVALSGYKESYVASCKITANQPGTTFPYNIVKVPTRETPSSPWCNGPDFGMAVFVA
jgi:hypothetical protein